MQENDFRRLVALDHSHLWHPFTQMRAWMADDDPLLIERGEGNYLIDVRGRRYLDGVASLWCNVHGHRKAELDRALAAQATRIAHSTMLGLSHPGAVELARELIACAPPHLTRVFYSDSGAEAVEVALRIAAQYWQLAGQPRRTRFLTLTESYHGDTLGSVSLGFSDHFHRHLQPLLFPVLKADPPHVYRFYRGLEVQAAEEAALARAAELLAQNTGEIAALIVEPLVQGAAGMWTHSAGYLRRLVELARAEGALVVFDEVATGFGRTGTMFACEQAGVSPDLMCLGKGITGGYMPLAATLANERVFEAFLGEPEEFRAFYYGHTYTGNPLATAVALANLEIFRSERVLDRIQPLIDHLREALAKRFAGHSRVADIRQAGLMAGVELMENPERRRPWPVAAQVGARICRAARKYGVILRPLGDVLVFVPPLSITEQEIDLMLDAALHGVGEIVGASQRIGAQ